MSRDKAETEGAQSPEEGRSMQSGSYVETGRMPLSGIQPGQTVKLIHIDGGGALQSRLATLGLIPGTRIEVVRNSSNGPFVVAVKGSRLVLGRGMAEQILVG